MGVAKTGSPLRRPARLLALTAFGVGAFAIAGLVGAPAPAGAATYTMTIAHLYPDDLTNNEAAPSLERFKQLVESATGGDIEVKVFGAGALGSEVETGKQAQLGKTIQSTLISSGAASSFYKKYQIVTTPFLFPNYKTAWAFFDSPWFANFMKGMQEESGLRYLGTFDDASRA
jgi:TRAP-type C4-dicarboxylate transport system substrate-binding protein